MPSGLQAGEDPFRVRVAASSHERASWFGDAAAALGLLVLIGVAVGIAAWELAAVDSMDLYVVTNTAVDAGQARPAKPAMPMAIAVSVIAVGLMVWRRQVAAERLARAARRLSPLVLAPLLPVLWHWQLWQGDREIVFLVLTGVLVFGGQRLLQISLATRPVFEGWGQPPRWPTLSPRAQRVLGWAPFAVVCAAAVGYAVFFSYHTIVHHRNVLTAAMDLGLEENVVWNILHGGQFYKSSPLVGPVGSHFGFHAALFAYLIAPFYFFSQRAETMLIVQAVLLGAAAIPLYLVARRHLPAGTACLVALLYIFYPPLHGSNLYDFHYPPLAPFFLWFTLYFVETRRNVLAVIFVAITLSIREDISPGLIVIGTILIVTNRRPRAGVLLAVAGVTYFVLMKMIIMPHVFSGQESFLYQYQGLVPPGERGFGGVLKTTFGNPVFTLGTLLDQEKLVYLLEIFLPLAFLPLRRPLGLLCCLPGFFFTLLSTGYRPLYQISFQYTAHWTAYLFIALIFNLAWMQRRADQAVEDDVLAALAGTTGEGHAPSRRRSAEVVAWKRSWLVALAVAMLFCTHQIGAVLQQNTARGGFGLYHFGTTADDLTRRRNLQVLLDKVPPKAKIVSAENIVPHLSNRADAYTLRVGVFDAEYMLFNVPPWERQPVSDALKSGQFGVMAQSGEYVLAKRGYPTTDNAGVLARMGQ